MYICVYRDPFGVYVEEMWKFSDLEAINMICLYYYCYYYYHYHYYHHCHYHYHYYLSHFRSTEVGCARGRKDHRGPSPVSCGNNSCGKNPRPNGFQSLTRRIGRKA